MEIPVEDPMIAVTRICPLPDQITNQNVPKSSKEMEVLVLSNLQ